MNSSYRVFLFVTALFLGAAVQAAEFKYQESFNGFVDGSKLASNNKPDASVSWTEEAYTTVVRLDSASALVGLKNVLLNKPKNSLIAESGDQKAVLFKYDAGPNSWSEQRFVMNSASLGGRKGLSELWLQYDIFIPDNFKLVDNNPNGTNWLGGGHKVFTLYADQYSYPNTTVIFGELFQRLPTKDNNAYNDSTLSTYIAGERIYTYLDSIDHAKWMDELVDLGRWQRRTLHFKFPTSATSNDGVVEAWVHHSNAKVNKVIDLQGGNFFSPTQNYFNAGYLNGFNNDGFAQATYLLIDNFIIAESKDSIDSTALLSSTVSPEKAKDCNVTPAPSGCPKN